ncbi:MAG TPA: trypsin-like peptidase domain-containing protein [Microcoleaceae cyanobacterium]|jgi:S1-C subfamily serine protease
MRQSYVQVAIISAVMLTGVVAVGKMLESIAASDQSMPQIARSVEPIETSLSAEPRSLPPLAPGLKPILPQPSASASPTVVLASPTVLPASPVPVQPKLSSRPTELSDATIYAQVNPAVVTIYVGREIGSGSIVSADGLVITNTHVVRRAVRRNEAVTVKLATGDEYSGQVIATDRSNDLALIRVVANSLPQVRLANTEQLQIGQTVYAIGSPFGRAGVMTTGQLLTITSKGDLQSSVPLKPGNSGGPLLNTQGEMIGVNKGIRPAGDGSDQMTSLATSVVVAKGFIDQNRDKTTSIVEPRFSSGEGLPPGLPQGFDRRDR